MQVQRGFLQLVNIWVEYPVYETDTGTLVRVLIRQLDVDLPETAFEGSYDPLAMCNSGEIVALLSTGPLNLT